MKINLLKVQKSLLSVVLFLSFIVLFSCPDSFGQKPKYNRSGTKSGIVNKTVSSSFMDQAKLASIRGRMQQLIDDRKVAGIVTLVQHMGVVVSHEAVGFQDIERNIPMQQNSVFRICSMTKPFAAAAIMMLQEEGKLQLDDPVEKYLPEFRNMWLKSEVTKEKITLVKPGRKVTIRDILRHTSGLLPNVPGDVSVNSIAEFVLVIASNPLVFDPGSKWQYTNSNMAAAGRIIELASGSPYEVFLSERIFKPLGMKDSHFTYTDEFLKRIAKVYHHSDDSALEPAKLPDWYTIPRPEGAMRNYPRPEGGLLSTAHDHAIWLQTMLNKGVYNGTRILTEESVMEMTKIQTGEFETGHTEGMSYGLGFGIVRNPTGVTAMLSKGTFGHGGLYGTQGWADPATNTIYIVFIQHQSLPGGDAHIVRQVFQEIAADGIVK